jgi:hypothetical protein
MKSRQNVRMSCNAPDWISRFSAGLGVVADVKVAMTISAVPARGFCPDVRFPGAGEQFRAEIIKRRFQLS